MRYLGALGMVILVGWFGPRYLVRLLRWAYFIPAAPKASPAGPVINAASAEGVASFEVGAGECQSLGGTFRRHRFPDGSDVCVCGEVRRGQPNGDA